MAGPALPNKLHFPTGIIVAHNEDSVSLIRQDPRESNRPDKWQEYEVAVYAKQPRKKGGPFIYSVEGRTMIARCAALNVSSGKQCSHEATADDGLCNTHRALAPARLRLVKRHPLTSDPSDECHAAPASPRLT